MRARHVLALALLVAALGGSASDAMAASPSAPALYARIARLPDELALLGNGGGSLGSLGAHPLLEIQFTNHDGYGITVVATGQTVALAVASAHGPRDPLGIARGPLGRSPSNTIYLAHGTVGRASIEASFADRGRIDLRFRPTGAGIDASRDVGCSRPSGETIARPGVFAGELSFRGEDGYTSADVHRVRGGSVDFKALATCLSRRPSPRLTLSSPGAGAARSEVPAVGTHPSRGPKPATLIVQRKLPVSQTVFEARSKAGDPTRFLALSAASEGSIGVIRFVSATARASAFAFDDSLATATVRPPKPFSGVGLFSHDVAGAKAWGGSLSVSFLGAPRFPLAGDAFAARLSRGF